MHLASPSCIRALTHSCVPHLVPQAAALPALTCVPRWGHHASATSEEGHLARKQIHNQHAYQAGSSAREVFSKQSVRTVPAPASGSIAFSTSSSAAQHKRLARLILQLAPCRRIQRSNCPSSPDRPEGVKRTLRSPRG